MATAGYMDGPTEVTSTRKLITRHMARSYPDTATLRIDFYGSSKREIQWKTTMFMAKFGAMMALKYKTEAPQIDFYWDDASWKGPDIGILTVICRNGQNTKPA